MISTQTNNSFMLAQLRSAQASGQHILQARAEAEASERQAKIAEQTAPAQPAVYGQPAGSSQAATLFFAQQSAQSSAETENSAESKPSAEEAFLDYMHKPLAERMREAILKDMGLTEEQLASLPAEEREKIEQKIQERIEQRMALDAADSAEDTAA